MQRTGGNRDRLSDRLTRGAPLAVILVFVVLILYQIQSILELIAVAALLALVLRTIVNVLERVRVPTWLSTVILFVGIAAILAFVWLVLVPSIRQELQVLISQGPGSLDALESFLSGLPLVPDSLQLIQRLEQLLTQFLGRLPQLAITALTVLGAVVAAVILAVYLAVSPDTYVSGILRLTPRDRRAGTRNFLDRLGLRLRGWITGMLIISAFVGTVGGVGLWILGVPLPLTFGIIAGALNIVPFAGSILGGALPALLALTISPTKALLVVALFTVINQVEGNILQPLVMGNQIKVPVAGILVSFLILGTLLGPIIGAILAVPTAVLVSVLLEEMEEKEPSLGGEEDREAGQDSSDDSGEKS